MEPWGSILRRDLAAAGQGTLKHRLKGVRVRAKTGTLDQISALSGWVWLQRERRWGAFSILSKGMPKSKAVSIENRTVRILRSSAHVAPSGESTVLNALASFTGLDSVTRLIQRDEGSPPGALAVFTGYGTTTRLASLPRSRAFR
jgi:D-Ala-D-Ala carboxypeptidase 3 (S13) family